jgi:hypothetical protein
LYLLIGSFDGVLGILLDKKKGTFWDYKLFGRGKGYLIKSWGFYWIKIDWSFDANADLCRYCADIVPILRRYCAVIVPILSLIIPYRAVLGNYAFWRLLAGIAVIGGNF